MAGMAAIMACRAPQRVSARGPGRSHDHGFRVDLARVAGRGRAFASAARPAVGCTGRTCWYHTRPMTGSRPFPSALLVCAAALLAAGLLTLAFGHASLAGIGVTGALAMVGLALRGTGYSFTAFVFVGVAASMVYPEAFIEIRGYRLSNLIVPLIQIIMFGMGTTLSVGDFARVLRMPRAVAIGAVLQYTVMPFVGYGLAQLFGFQGELAAGIVLVGAAPGGVASNVITYLAGGNVPLSVTMTAFSTLLSPIMTPFMMTQLAGAYVPISFTA